MNEPSLVLAATESYTWEKQLMYPSRLCRVAPCECDFEDARSRMYVAFRIPQELLNTPVRQAVLSLTQAEGESGGTGKIGVYAVHEALRAGAFDPTAAAYPLDYSRAQRSIGALSHLWDITDCLQSAGAALYLEIRMVDETDTDGSYACFYGVGAADNAPKLLLYTDAEPQTDALPPVSGGKVAETPGPGENMLIGHGMENFADLDAWTPRYHCDDFEICIRHSGALFGGAAAMFRAYTDADTESGLYQAVCLRELGTYSFSAYVRVQGDPIRSDIPSVYPGVYLRIRTVDGKVLQSRKIVSSPSYTRLCLTFTATRCTTVYAEVLMDGRGSVWVDGIQFEYGEAHPYNLICNAAFLQGERGLAHWECSPWGVYTGKNSVSAASGAGSLQLLADADSVTYVQQSIPLAHNPHGAGRFRLSGTAFAPGLIPGTFHSYLHPPALRIRARVVYNTGRFADAVADLSGGRNGEQTAFAEFDADVSRGAERIEVFCEYGGAFGLATFKGICLSAVDLPAKVCLTRGGI